MKLSRFGLPARRTTSSIQDRATRTWRPPLLARPWPRVSEARRVRLVLAGAIRIWHGAWDRQNTRVGTCVVPSTLVAVDALCKPQLDPDQLDVRHGLACLHRWRRLELLGHVPTALRWP